MARYGSCRFGGVYSRAGCSGHHCRSKGLCLRSPARRLPRPLAPATVGVFASTGLAIIKSRPLRREAPQWVGVPVGHGYNYFLACDTAERIIFAVVAGSGSGKLCWHSRGNDSDQENAGYVRESAGGSEQALRAEEVQKRSFCRCFWLLLSPQTKVARAGARNYPRRRQIMRLRRCAATPHLPRLRRATCLPAGRSAGLTRHRPVIQPRGPPGGRLEGVRHSRGRLGGCGGRSEKRLPWLRQAAASASAPVSVHAVLLTDNGDERLCP